MQVVRELFLVIINYLILYYLTLNNRFISNLVSMTNKKGAGGAREGAGRKPKILEVKLIEQMDRIAVPDEIWKALLYKIKEGDTQAIKLWLSYRLGLPKQQIDVTTNGESIAPPIQWISKGLDYKQAESIEFEELQRIENEEDI
jgi:hypothetical protein